MTQYIPYSIEDKKRFFANWCKSCTRYPKCVPIKEFQKNGRTNHWIKSDDYESFCNIYKEKIDSYESNTINGLDIE